MPGERAEMQARHGEILAEVADLCLTLGRRLHERAMAAQTDEAAQAAALAFHRVTRSLRQTLALEARLEREDRREAVEAVFRLAKMTPFSGISASKNDPLSLRL